MRIQNMVLGGLAVTVFRGPSRLLVYCPSVYADATNAIQEGEADRLRAAIERDAREHYALHSTQRVVVKFADEFISGGKRP